MHKRIGFQKYLVKVGSCSITVEGPPEDFEVVVVDIGRVAAQEPKYPELELAVEEGREVLEKGFAEGSVG